MTSSSDLLRMTKTQLRERVRQLEARPCVAVWEDRYMQHGVIWKVLSRREGHVFAFPDGDIEPGAHYAYCIGCGQPEHLLFKKPEKDAPSKHQIAQDTVVCSTITK